MARIRTIKPEFWDSPDTAKAGPWSRLCFIALWNWADDYGRGTANIKELEGFVFPNDEEFTDRSGNTVHFREVVAEVSECFGVVFYEVAGRPYYAIPSWDEHQRNERRAKQSKYPDPPVSMQVKPPVAEIPYKASELPRVSGAGTGEEGKRGTVSTSSVPDDSRFDEFWEVYPRRIAKKEAMKKFDKAVKDGVDPQELIDGAKAYAASVAGKEQKYIAHPTTWLNQGRWEDETTTTPTMSDAEAADRLRNPWKYT